MEEILGEAKVNLGHLQVPILRVATWSVLYENTQYPTPGALCVSEHSHCTKKHPEYKEQKIIFSRHSTSHRPVL